MKKTALLVLLICLFMVSHHALAALDRTVLHSVATSRDRALDVELGEFYYAESTENETWYKFQTEEAGEYCFFINKVQGIDFGYVHIEIYTQYKELIFRTNGVTNGEKEAVKLKLEDNTQYYMRIYGRFSNLLFDVETHQFAICGPDRHAGLGEEQVVKHATCSLEGASAQVCEFCGGWANEKPILAKGHVPGKWETSIDAGCETKGLMVQRCATCRSTLVETDIPVLGHQPGEMTVTLEATCRQPGIKSIQCQVCRTVLEKEEIPLGDHQPGRMTIVAAASCMQEGRKEQRCSVCGLLMAEEIEPATGHRNAKWQTLRDATCTAEGTRAQYCGACDETLNTEKILPYGHSYSEWSHIEPTCTNEGRNMLHCTVCGVEVNFEVLPAYGHQYTEWEMVKKATTKEEGQERCLCVRCGDTQMRATEKLSFFEGLFGK